MIEGRDRTVGRDASVEDLDALRRRLYRADATDDDRRRYLAAQEVHEEEPSAPPDVPAPSRRRRRVAAAVLIAAVVGIAAVATARFAAPVPVPTRTSTAVAIDGTTAGVQRFDGVGTGVLPVALPGAEFTSRSVVLAVSSDRASTVSWRATRPAFRTDTSSYRQVVATGRFASRPDSLSPSEFSYAGSPPTRIAVDAPPDVHWTLLISPAEATPGDLH